ncbi:hypothetical protein DFS34DRAFT_684868 [Phlyctochytrium arcticum]|nr:hypothetical protein DFS34DRAFT_684868 [Phlyctochytrium arcticum]
MPNNAESYTLHYWPEIPGRGEYIRLAFESSGVKFTDNTDVPQLQKLCMSLNAGHPPHFACPILEISTDGKSHYISQTPAILAYLAPKLGLLGKTEGLSPAEHQIYQAHINQLTFTILDLSNETHDTHHPVAVADYYEDQKAEAKRRADDFRANRAPKFLKYFNLTIEGNKAGKERLVGDKTTVADLTLFQVIDGLKFAFPRYMASLEKKGDYKHVFALHQEIATELKGYLGSERRRKFSNGLFRHYDELDAPAEK